MEETNESYLPWCIQQRRNIIAFYFILAVSVVRNCDSVLRWKNLCFLLLLKTIHNTIANINPPEINARPMYCHLRYVRSGWQWSSRILTNTSRTNTQFLRLSKKGASEFNVLMTFVAVTSCPYRSGVNLPFTGQLLVLLLLQTNAAHTCGGGK